MRIDGHTVIIPHIGFPTHAFNAPLIYNPYFATQGINALVVPMSCQAEHYPNLLRSLFDLGNIAGALITMPHKVSTVALVDELMPAAAIAGACNAVRRTADGRLQGDMFDGAGFVRGVQRKGLHLHSRRSLHADDLARYVASSRQTKVIGGQPPMLNDAALTASCQ
jgi:shikimate dehydrogenase